ncbi:MAG: molybdopterin-guanine dinucleotide biosynthesis protein B [Thermodesulfobacteriota bacterium]
MPLIFSIVGYSNSGKTRLLEKLIPILKQKGYSVGVIKHTGESFLLDQPAKDTTKFIKAGADGVVLSGRDEIAYWAKTDAFSPLTPDRMEQVFFSDRDILLTEGFKKGDKPKIVVLTKGKEEQLIKEIEGGIIATVGESPVKEEWPHFLPEEHEKLAQFLEARFLKKRTQSQVRVILDGKNIPINHFVQETIRGGLKGMLSPLKGFFDAEKIQITVHKAKKGPLT